MKSFFYIFVFFGHSLLAQKTYWVTPRQNYVLDGYIEILEDKTRQLGLDEVRVLQQKNQFKILPQNTFSKSYAVGSYWLHFKLNAKVPSDIVIELNNPRINQLEYYELEKDSVINQVVTGDSLTFKSRIFPHYHWVFPLSLKGEQKDVYVKLNKQYESLSIKVNLWNAPVFEANDRKSHLLWGILGGFTLLILLLNIVVWLATRDPIYGWFMFIILTNSFNIGAASGLYFQYVWPNFPVINSFYPQTFSTWLVILFQLYFMQLFIGQTPQNSRIYYFVKRFQRFIIIILAISIIGLIFNFTPKYFFIVMLFFSLTLDFLVIPLVVISIFERIQKREPIILFFTLVTLFKSLVLFFYLANVLFKWIAFDSLDVVLVDFLFDLIVLSLGVLYFGFRKFRLQNEQLLTSLHHNEQQQSKMVIEALEIERNRISEDLYDDVGAILSTAIGYLSSVLRKGENKEKFPILGETRLLLDRAVENLRTVSHNLMPKNFAQLGLSKSLEETINKVSQNSPIRFDYMLVGKERRLNPSIEVQIFRIAAELINDILKNSEASQATIQLVYGQENLTLIAEDDGAGEPIHNNLTSKVAFINGTLNMDVSPNGVTAVVEIPY